MPLRSPSALLLSGAACLMLAGGCLEEGDPVLATLDTEPPTLLRTSPPSGETPLQISPQEPVLLIFSEPMEPLSLRGGIKAQRAGTTAPIPLRIAVRPEDPADPPLAIRGDVEFLVEVRAERPAGFDPNSNYELVLTTILSDTEGNPLTADVVIPFTTGT